MLAKQKPSSNTHVPALDGLRGVAVLMVMLHHFVLYMPFAGRWLGLMLRPTLGMWCGVDLFFVLSGFLITKILIDNKGSEGYFRNFYARRVLRIFPLFYAYLILVFIIFPSTSAFSFTPGLNQARWFSLYFGNIYIFLHSWLPDGLVNHFWTLSIEEQFYFFWPLIIFLVPLRRMLPVCLFVIVTAVVTRGIFVLNGYGPISIFVHTVARMDSIAAGALVAIVLHRLTEQGTARLWKYVHRFALPVCGSLVIFSLWANYGGNTSFQYVRWTPMQTIFNYSILALAAVCFLLAAAAPRKNGVQRVLNNPGLRFFGKYSYALYVLHPLIAILLTRSPALHSILATQPAYLFVTEYLAIMFAVSISVSLLSWHILEMPFLTLKKYFIYGSERSPRVPRFAKRRQPLRIDIPQVG